jgi:ankyrin repeat protein
VNFLVPITGGIKISTDNTCKAAIALKTCLGMRTENNNPLGLSAYSALQNYQTALEHDIALLPDDHPIKRDKQYRLQQILKYLSAVASLESHEDMEALNENFPDFPKPIREVIEERSNLYSMVLRPERLDNVIRFHLPVFSMTRQGDQVLYHALKREFEQINILESAITKSPQAALEERANHVLGEEKAVPFETIQQTLTEQAKSLFSIDISFKQGSGIREISPAAIDEAFSYDEKSPASTEDYVKALIGYCARNIIPNPFSRYAAMQYSPFYMVDKKTNLQERISILTQFFLAIVNIDCYANQISMSNWGQILEQNPALSHALAATVKTALENGTSVEKALFQYINQHKNVLMMAKELNEAEMKEIQQNFCEHFNTIDGSQHYDDFTLLYTNKPGKFVTHQGSICINFADMIAQGYPELDSPFFAVVRNERSDVETTIPNSNESIQYDFQINKENIANYLNALPTHVRKGILYDWLQDMRSKLHRKNEYKTLVPEWITQLKLCANDAQAEQIIDYKMIRILARLPNALHREMRKTILSIGTNKLQDISTSAVLKNDLKTIQFLHTIGVNLNFKNSHNNQNTLVHIAAQTKHHASLLIDYLCRHAKIPLFEPNTLGCTAIHYLARGGHTTIISSINVHLDDKDANGRTPAHYAAESGHVNVLALLPKEALSQLDRDKNSPAHLAAKSGQIAVLQQLKACGINLSALSNHFLGSNTNTLIDCAIQSRQWETAYFLATEPPSKEMCDSDKVAQWRNFHRLSSRLNCWLLDTDSKWFSPERLKDIIETGFARGEFKNKHLWIVPNFNRLILTIAQLNDATQTALLIQLSTKWILGNNWQEDAHWLDTKITSLSRLNDLLSKLSSQHNKNLLVNLLDHTHLFSVLKSAVQQNDIANLKLYQQHIGNLAQYQDNTGCTLAHYLTKERTTRHAEACHIVDLSSRQLPNYSIHLLNQNIQAAYIRTPDAVYYANQVTGEFSEVNASAFHEATQPIKHDPHHVLSEMELNHIQFKTQHKHITTKHMMAFLCGNARVNPFAQDELGNTLLHYAATDINSVMKILPLVPHQAFTQKNRKGLSPVEILLKNNPTEASIRLLALLNKEGIQPELTGKSGLAFFKEQMRQALQHHDFKYMGVLCMMLKDTNLRWKELANVIADLSKQQLVSAFLDNLGQEHPVSQYVIKTFPQLQKASPDEEKSFANARVGLFSKPSQVPVASAMLSEAHLSISQTRK